MSYPRVAINVLYYNTVSSRPVIASSSVSYTSVEAALNCLTSMLYGPALVNYLPVPPEPELSEDPNAAAVRELLVIDLNAHDNEEIHSEEI